MKLFMKNIRQIMWENKLTIEVNYHTLTVSNHRISTSFVLAKQIYLLVGPDDDREKLNFPDSEVSSDFVFNFDFTSKG